MDIELVICVLIIYTKSQSSPRCRLVENTPHRTKQKQLGAISILKKTLGNAIYTTSYRAEQRRLNILQVIVAAQCLDQAQTTGLLRASGKHLPS
jgi:hypothetical protein